MAGIGPKLPLVKDQNYGFALTRTIRDNIKQSLKMLILTNPGERIMLPEYGVGLRRFLFENDIPITRSRIITKISEQVQQYIPYVLIVDVRISDDDNNKDMNVLHMIVTYTAAGIVGNQELDLYLETLNPYW